jgi:hypothetical protein
MLPWPHTFDHYRQTTSYDAAGGTILGLESIATNQACQLDASGGGLSARFGGDGQTSRVRLITEYSAIQNGDVVALQSGSQNYYRIEGGDDPMLATSGIIPTTYYWDVERYTATA